MNATQLREALAELDLRQKAFAEIIGVGQQTVWRWANGTYPVPPWVAYVLKNFHDRGVPVLDEPYTTLRN